MELDWFLNGWVVSLLHIPKEIRSDFVSKVQWRLKCLLLLSHIKAHRRQIPSLKVNFVMFSQVYWLFKALLILKQPIFPSSAIIPTSSIIYFDRKFQASCLFSPPLVFRTQECIFLALLTPNTMQSFRTSGFFLEVMSDNGYAMSVHTDCAKYLYQT